MSDLDMPMLEEEEEDEDELVDDDFQDDEGDEQDGDVDLEDMLAEELDGDGGEGDDGDDGDDGDEGEEDGEDEGEEDGDDDEEEDGDDDEEGGEGEEDVEVDEGPLSPTTGGQTEPVSATYTEGGEDAEGGVRQPVIDQGDLGPGDAAVQLTGSGGSLILPTSRSSPQMDEASGQGKEHNDNNDKNEEMDLEDDEEQNSEEEDDGDIGGDADGGEGGEDGEGGETGAEPVPDVHQQFALLLADPSVPRLPNDPSIIDVSRLTIEHRKVYNAKVMSLLTEEQLDRYECFRRSSLKEPMRRLVQIIVGGGMPKATDKVIVAMAGVGKVFVGELVEEARRIAESKGERGAIRKETMMEAFFRVRGGDAGGDIGGGSKRKRRRRLRL